MFSESLKIELVDALPPKNEGGPLLSPSTLIRLDPLTIEMRGSYEEDACLFFLLNYSIKASID